jgi:CheY-like chemotaxis protein
MFFKSEEQPVSGVPDKEKISKHLRAADEFFRHRNFDAALFEIDKAIKIDSKNSLARSFMERIKLVQKQLNAKDAFQMPTNELSTDEKMKLLNELFAVIEQLLAQKDYRRALEKVAEIYRIDSTNFYAKAYSDRIDELIRIETVEKAKAVGQIKREIAQKDQLPKGSFFMYREMLKEAWFDGTVTKEEEVELKKVRDVFGITSKEHFEIEREVKVEGYVEALQLVWRDGVVTENERKVLETMRQRYSISPEEHLSAESKIKEAHRGSAYKGLILVVDSDQENLNNVSKALKTRNYDVISAHRVEDALEVIISRTPDLILSEIFFSANSIDGFAFYKKMQELNNFKSVPFMFMTSMKEGKISRAGLRMGMDNFFTKPIDNKLVVATIEGKLRRKN